MRTRPISYARFSIGLTIDGYEVTDADGRPVTGHLDAYLIAKGIRDDLNRAAAGGRRALARALGCVEELA